MTRVTIIICNVQVEKTGDRQQGRVCWCGQGIEANGRRFSTVGKATFSQD